MTARAQRRPPQINVGLDAAPREALERVKAFLRLSGCRGTTAEAVRYAIAQASARLATAPINGASGPPKPA